MKKTSLSSIRRLAALLCSGTLVMFITGCATQKEKPLHERGWIGGEYRLAKAHISAPAQFPPFRTPETVHYGPFPDSVSKTQKAGIFVFKVNTNTPAGAAGLQKGDLILQLNHQPVTGLRQFRRVIDDSKPGTLLPVIAYRDGGLVDCKVPVGREKFREQGTICVVFPTVVHGWDLWPNPDFSFVLVGYWLDRGTRKELGTKREVVDPAWSAWLGIIEVFRDKHVVAQECVAPAAASVPSTFARSR